LPDWPESARGTLSIIPVFVTFACIAAAILVAGTTPLGAQVSPGPLSRPHTQLEGALKCFQCHGTGREDMDGKCLACHEAIDWLRSQERGLHGRSGPAPCASCHPEHAGLDFELIAWEEGSPEKFDHERAGWPLAGKHTRTRCRHCHQPRYQVSKAPGLKTRGDAARRWIGLETRCAACHEDPHTGGLGEDCARCHGQEGWKPAAGFDHAATYPLLGAHARVECKSCHGAKRLSTHGDTEEPRATLYKGLPHEECSDCHRDPHENRLGGGCAGCHVPESFKQIAEQAFDHDRTSYPLRGSHRRVSCASCHDATRAGGRIPPHETCGDCHGDAHAGQATLAGREADCAECHSVQGWTPSTFTVTQHASAAYPLEGLHLKVACSGCHQKAAIGQKESGLGTAGVRIRLNHALCTGCHQDDHRGELASRPDGGACESCHTVAGWKPSLFSAADHRRLGLPLDGRHGQIACSDCHGPHRRGLERLTLVLADVRCLACHLDPHAGRYSGGETEVGGPRCLECHDTRSFSPSTIGREVHASFSFGLEGAHRTVPCNLCHRDLSNPASTSSLGSGSSKGRELGFRQQRRLCVECHEDPHGDQFSKRPDAGDCSGCHGTGRFKPVTGFDHETTTAFPLKGAHARVPCADCHHPATTPSGRQMVIYSSAPSRCEACHVGGATGPSQTSSPGRSGRSGKRLRGIP
jgi:hypothetical protein